MVGWHLLLLLAIEVIAYGAIGRYAHGAWGWSTGAATVLAIGLYLGVRVILIAAEFAFARWRGDPIPPELTISPLRQLAMYLRELGGWVLMFSLILPFVPARRSVIDRPPGPPSNHPPVVLVHGLACNRMNWFWFRRQLARRGHHAFALDCTPWYAGIDAYPAQLGRAIDEVLAATGANQVALIGHSMGGLIVRAYLASFGDGKVAQAITLGSPHRGTWMTRFGFTANVRDMAENSEWLSRLTEREAARGPNPYAKFTCVFTYHDNLVTPQHNALLPGAGAIAVSGIGHLSLALSPAVLERVAATLDSRRTVATAP